MNGMEKSSFTYRFIEGIPDSSILNQTLDLYDILFDDARLDFFKQRIHEKQDVILVLCFDGKTLVGFKVGYRYDENTLYSWVGGVMSEYRNNGIANRLIKIQQDWAKEKGYKRVRTKSMNRFKPMMVLNLKNGFDIVKVYTNDSQQTKIIFEKDLSDY
tara:strand:+ start:79921 stop:80394 length:474 start_codon:yes stop_codon:yes gene_type:complete